jgi:hypothetical protein
MEPKRYSSTSPRNFHRVRSVIGLGFEIVVHAVEDIQRRLEGHGFGEITQRPYERLSLGDNPACSHLQRDPTTETFANFEIEFSRPSSDHVRTAANLE